MYFGWDIQSGEAAVSKRSGHPDAFSDLISSSFSSDTVTTTKPISHKVVE
jgi:hypothetical protein